MAEFIAVAAGSGSSTQRSGTKASGATATVRSWHGSVMVMMEALNAGKNSRPTKAEDIIVKINVEEGTKEYPNMRVLTCKLSDLLKMANEGNLLELGGERRATPDAAFDNVTLVCYCGEELVMGACPAGVGEGHFDRGDWKRLGWGS